MASKFTEHIDTAPASSHYPNVSLEDILAETRRRSSTGSGSSSDKESSSTPTSPSSEGSARTMFRRLTLHGKKS